MYLLSGLENNGYNNIVNRTENNHLTYSGKELEEEIGIDLADYGARRYMRNLGRWTSIDPYAKKYDSHSPFNYVLTNK